ncbi:DEAD/DEAH box helicase domain protein [Emticicia oligotrophica DSM 17448]|uniref:DEAD/DEAH box helicase domain protein n=1 Tax=Emticicia oligotrophica (strain DSM 17448 / CIP 109782 / MTCC 6937 / GPTSA100-15) TaxID=929562 RepID=A0ABN4AQU6_EMTOG|nr:DEAD/DEAH box helicase [Emticicia oligotrophica]AFK04852.1 DEAD/DEAH box helicase domain protein [Emticicia oligotrophica DSM 17448]
MLFESLNLIEPIRLALAAEGYTTPTPIQQQAIPIVLAGKDLIGVAQTGTGKTAAFSIPIIQQLYQKVDTNRKGKRKIKALIVTPTRELAIQIGESLAAYGANTDLKYSVIFGGVKQGKQTEELQQGVDILVATPGRLLDLIGQGIINLSSIEIFVLDEADRMLDMGFVHDVKRLIKLLPTKRQSLFFSATMPDEIVKLSATILNNPSSVSVTPVSSTADTIKQFLYHVDKKDKNALLLEILKDSNIETVLVFTRTKHGADKVVKMLSGKNIKAEAIHGNKAQNARQRALNNFKSKETRVLVATDIAARGIDVDDLAYVINYEIPNIPETYVHRIGRTGRAGSNGIAFSFCENEELTYLKDIQRLIGKKIPVIEEHPYAVKPNYGVVAPPQNNNRNKESRQNSNRPKQSNTSKPNPNASTEGSSKSKKKWYGGSRK